MMIKIFNDKYAVLRLRKGINVGPIFHTVEEEIYDLSKRNIIKEGKTITFHSIQGHVLYKGDDYIYIPFSLHAFFRTNILERVDRINEKYREHRIKGVRIRGTDKYIRVKDEGFFLGYTWLPTGKSISPKDVIVSDDGIQVISRKIGKTYYFKSDGYEIVDKNMVNRD